LSSRFRHQSAQPRRVVSFRRQLRDKRLDDGGGVLTKDRCNGPDHQSRALIAEAAHERNELVVRNYGFAPE